MNTASTWLARGMARLHPGALAAPRAVKASAGNSGTVRPPASPRTEPTGFTRDEQRLLKMLQAIVAPQISEVEAVHRAEVVAQWHASASAAQRLQMWRMLSEQFAPDGRQVAAARDLFDSAQGTAEEGAAEIRLRKALVSPRTRLLQRFSAMPGGMRFLLDLRAELLQQLKVEKRLLALDAELEALFSTWFDVGFLELRRISWDSPASLIEKLIKYEAVHDIRSWADLKNRLDSDRRCYGFFHPRLPDEPLIFVEVALLGSMPGSIAPLLDETAAPSDLTRATTAIFYSISNTQTGLRGVSFGESLIKRVVETLHQEFPKLRTYVTLSPIPGFRAWLSRHAQAMLEATPRRERTELARLVQQAGMDADDEAAAVLTLLETSRDHAADSPLPSWLMHCAAHYLGRELQDGRPVDAVARFHLGNGARVERINWGGDPGAKGWKQSYGIMVNYLYDLKRLDRHRQQLGQGKIAVSGEVSKLLF